MNLAKVVAVHPESHSVDLLMLDDGRRVPGVRVVSSQASSSSGLAALVKPDAQAANNPYTAPNDSQRDLIAVVGYYRELPIVLGFLFPEVSQCLFADLDRYLNRTPSDAYWTVDGKANAEFYHPSGAFVRFGTSPAHEDMTGKDFDKVWKVTRNTDQRVHIHIEQAGGVGMIDIAPDGSMVVRAPKVTIDAPETQITGHLTVGKGVTSTGDVTADGVSLETHTHGGVQAGGASTAKPN